MTIERFARLMGDQTLRDPREGDVRRVMLAVARMTYEQGRADALDEVEALITRKRDQTS